MFSVKITFLLFECYRSIDNSIVKRLMITRDSVVKIQNLIGNHESRSVKSNPAIAHKKWEDSEINNTEATHVDPIFYQPLIFHTIKQNGQKNQRAIKPAKVRKKTNILQSK